MVPLVKFPLRIVVSAVLPVEENVGVVIPIFGDDTECLRRVTAYEEGMDDVPCAGRWYEVWLRGWWWWLVFEVPVPSSVDSGLKFSDEGVRPVVGVKTAKHGETRVVVPEPGEVVSETGEIDGATGGRVVDSGRDSLIEEGDIVSVRDRRVGEFGYGVGG